MGTSIQVIGKRTVLPKGFFASGLYCGVKRRRVPDLSLLFTKRAAHAAGVFTTNRVKSWTVQYCQRILRKPRHYAILANSGNANCYNGPAGKKAVSELARVTARYLKVKPSSVFVSSTGIIGKRFPTETIVEGIPRLVSLLSTQGGSLAAQGILTTDKHSKEATVRFRLDGCEVTLCGYAKGAGMLHPNMATMLAFFATDAAISKSLLRQALRHAAGQSFNRISIDNDMSTNDSVIILANGQAKNPPIGKRGARFLKFQEALTLACCSIAREMVRGGEGVKHVCEVRVQGARDLKEAESAARSLADSMLFKTMLAGADPNWGRVVAALGAAKGVNANLNRLDLWFGDQPVLRRGRLVARYRGRLRRVLQQKEYTIELDLHHGTKSVSYVTSDLTKKYVHINAAYST